MIFLSATDWILLALPGAACVALGYSAHVLLLYVLSRIAGEKARAYLEEREARVQKRLDRARTEAAQEVEALRNSAVGDIEDARETAAEFEQRLSERAQDIGERDAGIGAREEELGNGRREIRKLERGLRDTRRRIGRVRGRGREILLGILETTPDDFKQRYLDDLDEEVRRETGRYLERLNQAAEEEAEGRARDIVERVTGRMEVSHAREERPAGIDLSEVDLLEKKGFQPDSPLFVAFQEATGVEVSVDPETRNVTFNAVDGVRREVARRALNRLLGLNPAGEERGSSRRRKGDGGRRGARAPEVWTPENVKELVERTAQELRRLLHKKGRKAVATLKLQASSKLSEYLGRLAYRTSYGQNILRHSQEVGFLGGLLGAEVRLDHKVAKRCAFLHDVGKCIDFELEGGHPEIGGRLARECGEDETIINAIEAHHEDVPRMSLYPLIVQAADAISGARPGARRRTAEKYLIRMGQIEQIATNKPGVESAYVIQAGREVRIIMDADKTSDADADGTAKTVARELEDQMQFPGTIRVTVVREKRVSATAK